MNTLRETDRPITRHHPYPSSPTDRDTSGYGEALGRMSPCEGRNIGGSTEGGLSVRQEYLIGERVEESLVCTSSVALLPAALVYAVLTSRRE